MKKSAIISFFSAIAVLIACDKDETGIPEITIIQPGIGETFNSGDTIRFLSNVKDDDLFSITWGVSVDSSGNTILGFTDTLSLKDVAYGGKFIVTTEKFADYKLRITARDKSGNTNAAFRGFSVRP